MKIAKQTSQKLGSILAEILTFLCTTIRESSILISSAKTESKKYQSLHLVIQA